MPATFRDRILASLIDMCPGFYLKRKGLADHPLARAQDFLRLHATLVRDGEGVQHVIQRYNLWSLSKRVAGRPGVFAEVGVYRGGSAKILCETKGNATLHLFDTFKGMPRVDPTSDGGFHEGQFSDVTLDSVRSYLAKYQGVEFHPEIFPASSSDLMNKQLVFQFVHLDVDIRQSTFDALNFFYPLLAPGGLLISHDYGDPEVPGVRLAFEDFMRDKPEKLLELGATQVLLEKKG